MNVYLFTINDVHKEQKYDRKGATKWRGHDW